MDVLPNSCSKGFNESHYQQSHAGALSAFQRAKAEDSTSDLPAVINRFRSDTMSCHHHFSPFFWPRVCSVAALAAARLLLCCWGCGGELDSDALAARGGCWGMIPPVTLSYWEEGCSTRAGWGNWEGPGSWRTGGCTARGWFPCSPALSASAGWTSRSPRCLWPLLGRDSGTLCLTLALLAEGLVPAMGTCHGHSWSPHGCSNSPATHLHCRPITYQLLEIRWGLP